MFLSAGLALGLCLGAAGDVTPGKLPTLAGVSERMRQAVAERQVAGVITVVATPQGILHFDVTGKSDIEAGTLMGPENIFWIASMSKPVLAVLLLMLQDEGKLSADDPVDKHLPEFKKLQLANGKPARVTIRHLLTHTSGMGEITPAEASGAKTLADAVALYITKPVAFEPGSKWVYCQSGINTAGRICEVVSGMSFDQFAEKRLFGPLGMKDTTFYLSTQQLPRLAKSYKRTDKGDLEATDIRFLNGTSPASRDRFPAPNGGLFSTASDYTRFCRMILAGGEFEGRRYLSARSIEQMSSIHTGELKTGFTPGNGWGLGWCVVREPQGLTAPLSAGSFGHGGAYGTQAWIDPVRKRIYVLMVQRSNFSNSDGSDVRRAFQEAARAALEGK